MLKSIAVGALLTIVTVCIHAVCTSWWLQRLPQYRPQETQQRGRFFGTRILCTTATFLLLVHILEVTVWAVVYLYLPDLDELADLEQAVYFSTVTFAALGYGDVFIAGPWRLLSAIQSMTGLLIFGWSTALLYAVVQRLWTAEKS